MLSLIDQDCAQKCMMSLEKRPHDYRFQLEISSHAMQSYHRFNVRFRDIVAVVVGRYTNPSKLLHLKFKNLSTQS